MEFSLVTAQNPQVSILGAGALGSVYGAFLSEAGCSVTLIARNPEYVRAVNQRGLLLHQAGEERIYRKLRAVGHLREATPPDLLLVLVKGPDTEKAAQDSAAFVPPACTVLTLQNGLGNLEKLARFLPPEQLVPGVTYVGAALAGPGEVLLSGMAGTILGETDGQASARVDKVESLLKQAVMPVKTTNNIQGHMWTKLLINIATNPVAALTRLNNGALTAQEDGQALIRGLVEEAAALAHALHIKLETDDPAGSVLKLLQNAPANRPSMLQDVLRSHRTEIDSLNGAIVEKAAALGLPVPLNLTICRLVRLLDLSIEAK
jgi:2-dehydropantoate 2-reductase